MNKFWRFSNESGGNDGRRNLYLRGAIAEASWFDDVATPSQFRAELFAGKGKVDVYINSPGGDCFAAAQIYNMLLEYPYEVAVHIDSLAASAASVIAMAGEKIFVSPVSMIMIHNPATIVCGEAKDMDHAKTVLESVKESIINAYELRTGLSREVISDLMDKETWMDANKAIELGFANQLCCNIISPDVVDAVGAERGSSYSANNFKARVFNKIKNADAIKRTGPDVRSLLERLEKLKNGGR